MKVIYYNFKPLNLWLLFNIIITLAVCAWFMCDKPVIFYPQMWILFGTVIFSWILWFYKYIHPQVMAVITNDSIKIDHTNPLKWKDIDYAQEKDVDCCFRKHRVLALIPKKNTDYKYNWLQKHNPFPEFSIPLYGLLTPENEKEIVKIIAEKVKIKQMVNE